MRFYDSWWEHFPTVLRFAPLIAALIAVATQHALPMDYYWE
jgi:hypothetical protein